MSSANHDGPGPEPIAIIGLACRFGGDATSPERFWRMIEEARDAWSPIPAHRFNVDSKYHPDSEKLGTTHVRGGHFIEEDIGLFDASFFNLSTEASSALDPQYRLQLEVVYEALENAGLPLDRIAGSKTSVFAGTFFHDYSNSLMRDQDNIPRLWITGNGAAMASNLVSHFFDFCGPSLSIDTGCSSTLVALHQAVQNLRNGESDMSVVTGSNLLLNSDLFKTMGSIGFLSPDGRSYAFDSRANGYGRGDGVATVVIKRLKDAVAANDAIRAVIRETGINQDGKTQTITSPSCEAQVDLMRRCYANANLDPKDTQFLEAHGSGTLTGDPLEARGLASVFKSDQSGEKPAWRLGSVKSNVGHTESVSGLASVLKVVLALERRIVPPNGNFLVPNPQLDLKTWRFEVLAKPGPWSIDPAGVRRASVSNYGYGGANAHAIIEEAPARQADGELPSQYDDGSSKSSTFRSSLCSEVGTLRDEQSSSQGWMKILVISAKSDESCRLMISNLRTYLGEAAGNTDEKSIFDPLIYTLSHRRSLFEWRAAFPIPVDTSAGDAVSLLDSPSFHPTHISSSSPRLGMVFTGQGAQWHAMGQELIQAYPVFRASLEKADADLATFGAQWSLMDELGKESHVSRVNDVALSMPLCVALQIALVLLLRSWKITPAAITSHSSGEIAAAFTAGAIDSRTAMAIAYYRSALAAGLQASEGDAGAMLVVGLDRNEAQQVLDGLMIDGQAIVACINSPQMVTISGDSAVIEAFHAVVKQQDVFSRRLKIGVGYHSHHMERIADAYRQKLLNVVQTTEGEVNTPVGPKIPRTEAELMVISSPVTGGHILDAAQLADPEHWVRSLLQPVEFLDAFTNMLIDDLHPSGVSVDMILEVGPHTTLRDPIQQILRSPEFDGHQQLPYMGCLARNQNAILTMQTVAAGLLKCGYKVDLDAVNFPLGVSPSSSKLLTDLPSYPWNHSRRYWLEPRLNHSDRINRSPVHALLGTLVPGSNHAVPSWRNFLRVTDIPWATDRMVGSEIIFPESGFVSLALAAVQHSVQIEAVPKNPDKTGILTAYRLRDVEIVRALVIPDDTGGVEIQTTLRPTHDGQLGRRGWKQFEVCSVTMDNQWTCHATALIKPEYDDGSKKVVPERSTTSSSYTRLMDPADLFATLRSVGVQYGPRFRNIKAIARTADEKSSLCKFLSLQEAVPSQTGHPILMESAVISAYTTLPSVEIGLPKALALKSIRELRVSSSSSLVAGRNFEAHSVLAHSTPRSFIASVSMFDGEENQPVLELLDMNFESIVGAPSSSPHVQEHMCGKLEWGLDLSFPSPQAMESIQTQLVNTVDPAERNLLLDIRRVCIHYLQNALTTLAGYDLCDLPPHHAKYYTWMQEQLQQASTGVLMRGSESWVQDDQKTRQRLVEQVSKASVAGGMVCHVGQHLAAFLRGQMVVLEHMMQDGMLHKYYEDSPRMQRASDQAARLLAHLAHRNPQARILEIGAGTGGATRSLLEALTEKSPGAPLASLYHFTDVSAGFFPHARERFDLWESILAFDRLDIEQAPATQGFELGSYDVVIACEVLHATRSMANTMSNVRSLLKPGGTLLLIETTRELLENRFIFGLLPGWWLGEEPERHDSPSLSIESWQRLLVETNFSGLNFHVRDCGSDQDYSVSTILATVPPLSIPSNILEKKLALVVSDTCRPPAEWLTVLQDRLGRLQVHELETTPSTAYRGRICIFLGDINCSLIWGMNEAALNRIRSLAAQCKALLWLTQQATMGCENPEGSLTTGFVRSLRNEHVGREFVTFDLDSAREPWDPLSASLISNLTALRFSHDDDYFSSDVQAQDFEYAERGGMIFVPRYYRDGTRNKIVSPDMSKESSFAPPALQPFTQLDRCASVQIMVQGQSKTCVFTDDPGIQDEDLGADDVEVEPRAFGVNQRDVLDAMGELTAEPMSHECSGIVKRIGPNAAQQGIRAGDQVICLQAGDFAPVVRTAWANVIHKPAGLTFEQAASIPVAFTTAYLCLVKIVHLQKGQSVLINAAAEGVGQAAVQIALHIGADVFVTVSSPEKKALMQQNYHIPEDRIFNSRDRSFVAGILAATEQCGVDVVLNSLAGVLLQESFNIVAPFGHFVELGKRDFQQNSALEMQRFSHNVSFTAFDLTERMHRQPSVVHFALSQVVGMLEKGILSPTKPIAVHPISNCMAAFQSVQEGRHVGKVVLSVASDDVVPVRRKDRAAALSQGYTYLFVGECGAVGQSILRWMVGLGARNLIVLSRSAAADTKFKVLGNEFQDRGCRAEFVSCDVANLSDLEATIVKCRKQGMPEVRGIIHGAVVLQEHVLEQKAVAGFFDSIKSSVQATRNLDAYFMNLDFFISLSSTNGILGHASQSNYAAVSTYQNAMMQQRLARGLPGASIDLGLVKTLGDFMTESGITNRLRQTGHKFLTEGAMFRVLDSVIKSPRCGQVITGIDASLGTHWDGTGPSQLGRDSRFLALRQHRTVPDVASSINIAGENGSAGSGGGSAGSLSRLLAEPMAHDKAQQAIAQAIAQRLASIFSISPQEIDLAKSPGFYGVDSLVAVDVRNLLAVAEVAVSDIMQSASLMALAGKAADNIITCRAMRDPEVQNM